jgi:hypothetical protein
MCRSSWGSKRTTEARCPPGSLPRLLADCRSYATPRLQRGCARISPRSEIRARVQITLGRFIPTTSLIPIIGKNNCIRDQYLRERPFASVLGVGSELNPCAELHRSGTILLPADNPKSRRIDAEVRGRELHAIEGIEHLRAQLDRDSLSNQCVLNE